MLVSIFRSHEKLSEQFERSAGPCTFVDAREAHGMTTVTNAHSVCKTAPAPCHGALIRTITGIWSSKSEASP